MSRVILVNDRYNGSYSGALWTAWFSGAPDEIDDSDVPCMLFWEQENIPVHGRGCTPEEALNDLITKVDIDQYI